jgi:hypothetical protein
MVNCSRPMPCLTHVWRISASARAADSRVATRAPALLTSRLVSWGLGVEEFETAVGGEGGHAAGFSNVVGSGESVQVQGGVA